MIAENQLTYISLDTQVFNMKNRGTGIIHYIDWLMQKQFYVGSLAGLGPHAFVRSPHKHLTILFLIPLVYVS